jgi:hypothetical protein
MKSDIVSITINIKWELKERADAVKERHGDLTRMIEQGLELVVEEREKRTAIGQSSLKETRTKTPKDQLDEAKLTKSFN